jgi:ABC-2 type transport system permease protein
MRNLRVILILIKMKLSHMMVFRLSFFGAFFIDGSLFAIQLLVFSTIYSNMDSIGGWTRGEMIVFIGTFSLINAFNMVLFFFGVNEIPNKIINGGLDHYITKPMSPLLRLTFENVNLGSLPLVLASIGIIEYGITQMNIVVPPLAVIGYCFLVLLMTVLWYDVMLILRTVPFFVNSAQNIGRAEELLGLCMKVPGTLFKGAFKVLFYFVLPYGVMSTIPTQMIAGTLTPLGFAYGVGIVILFTSFALWLWRLGLKHYKSASS